MALALRNPLGEVVTTYCFGDNFHKHDVRVLDKREEQPVAGGTAESKAAKFSRLASARVRRAVKAINLVGALASAQYEKTPAQVDKIESYLNAAVRAAVARLRGEAEGDDTIEI